MQKPERLFIHHSTGTSQSQYSIDVTILDESYTLGRIENRIESGGFVDVMKFPELAEDQQYLLFPSVMYFDQYMIFFDPGRSDYRHHRIMVYVKTKLAQGLLDSHFGEPRTINIPTTWITTRTLFPRGNTISDSIPTDGQEEYHMKQFLLQIGKEVDFKKEIETEELTEAIDDVHDTPYLIFTQARPMDVKVLMNSYPMYTPVVSFVREGDNRIVRRFSPDSSNGNLYLEMWESNFNIIILKHVFFVDHHVVRQFPMFHPTGTLLIGAIEGAPAGNPRKVISEMLANTSLYAQLQQFRN
jgi:hypothetical protein